MITITVDSHTRLLAPAQMTSAEQHAVRQIRDRLTFPNPKFTENERRGFSNWKTPRELCFLKEDAGILTCPRGFTRQLIEILKSSGAPYQIDDQRRTLPEVEFTFQGTLRDYQRAAVDAMAARDFGTLPSSTGSGKTTMALSLIARRRQPALIICHTTELALQWVSRIEQFLGIPGSGDWIHRWRKAGHGGQGNSWLGAVTH